MEGIQSVIVEKESASVSFEQQGDDGASFVKQTLCQMGYPIVDDENGMLLKAKSFVSCTNGKMRQQ
ncbi:heavy metal transporter [Allomuricauda sp. CP2A]|jgi:hypothetical protein|uniref:heavy metal transporter n=1 Tax=Allomuricauda sp. CP2A TaxID=1848189 RepID=UPI000B25994B|nr:heavy metal transporter [Muricauda sp. CP2A]